MGTHKAMARAEGFNIPLCDQYTKVYPVPIKQIY